MRTVFVLSFMGVNCFDPEDSWAVHSVYATAQLAEAAAIRLGKNLVDDNGEVPDHCVIEVDFEG